MLLAENVFYRHSPRGSDVLSGVGLSLAPGEILGLTGRSGRGKTTLARLLAGYAAPDSGTVTVDGVDARAIRGYHPVQLVAQHPEKALNPRWKMRDVLAESGVTDERVVAALGIEDGWLARYPGELSGGELQRFCVARALTDRTRYLIADEMTAMLDASTQAQLWRIVLDWARERGAGVLAISHDEALLDRVCSRVVRLDES